MSSDWRLVDALRDGGVLMIDDDSAVAGASESAVPRQPSDAPTARGPSRGPDGRRLKN